MSFHNPDAISYQIINRNETIDTCLAGNKPYHIYDTLSLAYIDVNHQWKLTEVITDDISSSPKCGTTFFVFLESQKAHPLFMCVMKLPSRKEWWVGLN